MRPNQLILVNGAMALDGGSIYLETVDPAGHPFEFSLAWSIDVQMEGTSSLAVNGVQVDKGSPEEAAWLDLLRAAQPVPSGEGPPEDDSNPRLTLLPPGDADYFGAISRSPDEALLNLAQRLVEVVMSEAYQRPNGSRGQPSLETAIRALAASGAKIEAIRVYRLAHPSADLVAAKLAVDRIAAETPDA